MFSFWIVIWTIFSIVYDFPRSFLLSKKFCSCKKFYFHLNLSLQPKLPQVCVVNEDFLLYCNQNFEFETTFVIEATFVNV